VYSKNKLFPFPNRRETCTHNWVDGISVYML
jgi:hypothetical protein